MLGLGRAEAPDGRLSLPPGSALQGGTPFRAVRTYPFPRCPGPAGVEALMYRGGYPPPPRASAGGGLAALVAITARVWLVAPHAQALRPQVQAARSILAGNLPG